jgi:hypothetical protein
MQSDDTDLGMAFHKLVELRGHVAAAATPDPESIAELPSLLDWAQMLQTFDDTVLPDVSSVMHAAGFLHPRTLKEPPDSQHVEALSGSEKSHISRAMEGILQLTPAGTSNSALLKEFNSFRTRSVSLLARDGLLMRGLCASTSALSVWSALSAELPLLGEVSERMYGIPPSSAGMERTWSTFRFIHSDMRNSLGRERVDKLVVCNKQLSLDATATRSCRRKKASSEDGSVDSAEDASDEEEDAGPEPEAVEDAGTEPEADEGAESEADEDAGTEPEADEGPEPEADEDAGTEPEADEGPEAEAVEDEGPEAEADEDEGPEPEAVEEEETKPDEDADATEEEARDGSRRRKRGQERPSQDRPLKRRRVGEKPEARLQREQGKTNLLGKRKHVAPKRLYHSDDD